jgi:hypothetical protein
MKENWIKFVLIFGGGLGLFAILKKVNDNKMASASSGTTKSADGSSTPPDTKNADIVANAYAEALKAGETPQRLTELNKELTKEFGMRCYVSEDNKLTVCDVKGNTILTK